jgi:AmiR/NasT family two-component response regulator
MHRYVEDTSSEIEAQVALQRLLEVTATSFQERGELVHALESRIVIEQAKGMLAERLRLSLDDAFVVLRSGARSSGSKLHDLARRTVQEPDTPIEILGALGKSLKKVRGKQ